MQARRFFCGVCSRLQGAPTRTLLLLKAQLVQLLTDAVAALQADGTLPADITPEVMIERTRDRAHGDFASNLALMLAKPARRKPREIAEQIVARLAADDAVSICFSFSRDLLRSAVPQRRS